MIIEIELELCFTVRFVLFHHKSMERVDGESGYKALLVRWCGCNALALHI